MKRAPIVPADLAFDADGVPFSPRFGDVYHPRVGAEAQARHVFLGGNGLPARWRGRDGFTVLETGFGLGHNFLVTWDAWRSDPSRSARLSFVSVELHPVPRDALRAIHARQGGAHAGLAAQLVEAWPPAVPGLHRIAFDEGRVELLLALGDATAWLPELELAADAFFLDGFAPARNPALWGEDVCKALGRLAADGATLATWSAAQGLRQGLARAGFDVQLGAGIGGKRDITLASFRPRHRAAPGGRRAPRPPAIEPRALIVGAGLAGTATAAALAERGWSSTIVDRAPAPAAGASGNPAGLFHGTVHADDGVHARFTRAAALAVAPWVAEAVERHGVAGATGGFLRLETRLGIEAMRSLAAGAGLPADYVEPVDASVASALAGFRIGGPAWHYPAGGWVDPVGLARAAAARAGDRLSWRLGTAVASIRPAAGGWQLAGADGRTIDEAGTLILANADDALRLLGDPGWPVERLRGQLSVLAGTRPAPLRGCRRPVAGGGYAMPVGDGLVFGATRQRDDDDPAVRADDHAQNVARLEALAGVPLGIDLAALAGRTAWRASASDRLPLIGAVPALDVLRGARADAPRWTQPRHVPREPGLFVFAALGSRGIATSALGAHVIAAGVTGRPSPLESSLLDAIDPARFLSRALRLGARPAPQGAGCS